MRSVTIGLVCGLLLVTGAIPATAQSTADHIRYDMLVVESAIPLAPGEIELEFGLDYSTTSKRGGYDNRWGPERRRGMRFWDWGLGVTFGLAPNLDTTLHSGISDIKDGTYPFGDKHGRGLDDLEWNVKWMFFEDTSQGLSLAYVPGLTIPTGLRAKPGRLGPGQAFLSFDQKLVLTQDWTDWTLSADIGYSLPLGHLKKHYSMPFANEVNRSRGVMEANIGISYTAIPNFQPVVECNYAHEWVGGASGSDLFALTFGAVVPVNDTVRFKVGW